METSTSAHLRTPLKEGVAQRYALFSTTMSSPPSLFRELRRRWRSLIFIKCALASTARHLNEERRNTRIDTCCFSINHPGQKSNGGIDLLKRLILVLVVVVDNEGSPVHNLIFWGSEQKSSILVLRVLN